MTGKRLNTRSQILSAWCGPLSSVLLFVGMLIMGFFPPTPPSATAAEVVAIYQANPTGIRIGSLMILIGGAFVAPWLAAVSVQLKRIEGDEAPVLTLAQFAAGAGNIMLFVIPAVIFAAVAYRPDRLADTLYLLNDLGWFFIILPFCLVTAQTLCIGFVILSDDRPEPIFPRWLGYLNFWIGILSIPASLLVFVKTGPFAWNGLFSFWVPACVFGLWFFSMALYVDKAARRQALAGQNSLAQRKESA